jgi:uncharacterized damage-inducible protein DinB
VSENRKYPDLWIDPEKDPRQDEQQLRGERAVVLAYLRHYRMTLELKCDGLSPEQLARRSVPPSTMSLLGLVRHMAKVEHSWCRRVVEGQPELERLYRTEEDPDLDFNGATAHLDVVTDAWESWRREVAHAEEVYAAAPFDNLCPHHDGDLEVREVLVHLVEEYARHCGHADLLRECIDGRTGQ